MEIDDLACGYNKMTPEISEVLKENMKYLKKLKEINFRCKNEDKIDNFIGDDGFASIFNNAKYLSNLEKLDLNSKKEQMKIDCGITSSKVIRENIKHLNKLKEICLDCKNRNKLGNKIRDDGCFEIFNNTKYLTNLEKLNLTCNKA